jgi:phosphate-selective porin OprO/OprP
MFIWSKKGTRRRRLTSLALAGSLLAVPVAGLAASPTKRELELEERVRKLERIIEQSGLGKGKAAPAQAEAPLEKSDVEAIVDTKIKQQKVLAGWKDGFYLESPSGDFKLKLRGYIQTDARFFPLEQGDTGTDSIFLRRVRPIFEGTVYKYFDYKIMPDFGGGNTVLQDAYSEITYFKPWTSLRAGKFKVPFSLERLQGGDNLLFIERSLTQNLAPNRDVGFQFGGDLFDGALSYQAGYFNGVTDGQTSGDGDSNSDKEGAARIFAQPFKNTDIAPLKGLGFGAAGTFGDQKKGDNQSSVRFTTAGRSAFFRYATSDDITIQTDGEKVRFSPQAYYYWGPFGFMGEYILSRQGLRRANADTGGVIHDTFMNTAWFAQGSWVLTGENRIYNPVEGRFDAPKQNYSFNPAAGTWGMFELAARYSVLDLNYREGVRGAAGPTGAVRGGEQKNLTFGGNWYLDPSMRIMLDYQHVDIDRLTAAGAQAGQEYNAVAARAQVTF